MEISIISSFLLHGLGFILLAFLIHHLVDFLRYLRQLPPGPYGIPILGYLPWIDPQKPHVTLTNLSKKYGKIYSMKFGNLTTVVLADPALIRQAFASDVFSGRADLYVTHGIMDGYGLIVAEGERWKEQRRFAVRTLKNFGMVKHGSKRQDMEKRIMVGVDSLLQKLKASRGKDVDLTHPLLHSVGTVMNSLVLGKVWAEDDPTWIWLQERIEEGVKMMQVAGPINFIPWLRFIPKYRKTIEFLINGKNATHELYEQIFLESRCDSEDFISVYKMEMERRKNFPTPEPHSFVKEQCHHFLGDMIGAGTDTTSTSLKWFFLLLVMHPEVQVKIQEELDQLRIRSDAIELSDFEEAVYFKAAFAESLRIRPIVTVGIPHATTTDTTLAGFHLPKRSMVIPLLWAINMDPQHWPNPEQYRPERFIDSNGSFSRPDFFMPFQVGKRMCPGDELSRMMTFLFCTNVLHRYFLSSPNSREDLQSAFEGECGLLYLPKKYLLNFTLRD